MALWPIAGPMSTSILCPFLQRATEGLHFLQQLDSLATNFFPPNNAAVWFSPHVCLLVPGPAVGHHIITMRLLVSPCVAQVRKAFGSWASFCFLEPAERMPVHCCQATISLSRFFPPAAASGLLSVRAASERLHKTQWAELCEKSQQHLPFLLLGQGSTNHPTLFLATNFLVQSQTNEVARRKVEGYTQEKIN